MVVQELKAGATFEEDGNLFRVLSYEHIKMGRGSATIKVKLRNVRSGAVVEKGFTNGAQVNAVSVDKKEYQYLYKDGESAFFMNPNTFEQVTSPLDVLDGSEYLQEGSNATLEFYGDEVLGVVLPPKITLKVSETDPGVKGNSASNMYKDAVLENGIRTRVPLFINIGDSIVVDTRDGSYTKRA
ncbi:MAG TPA: elongation factor P [Candidatus Levybacteria bacterium]|nr:elongation factor P [Candidatus Levybacteria bacterium]